MRKSPARLRLYDKKISDGGVLIDSYSYAGNAPENKSYARIPDGTGDFVDPMPTPLKPNVVEETTTPETVIYGIDDSLQTDELTDETNSDSGSILELFPEPSEDTLSDGPIQSQMPSDEVLTSDGILQDEIPLTPVETAPVEKSIDESIQIVAEINVSLPEEEETVIVEETGLSE